MALCSLLCQWCIIIMILSPFSLLFSSVCFFVPCVCVLRLAHVWICFSSFFLCCSPPFLFAIVFFCYNFHLNSLAAQISPCVCVECQGFVALRSHISLFFFLQKCLSVLCIRSLSFIIIFHRFLVGLFVRLILFDTMLLVSFHSITFFFCVSPFFLSLLLSFFLIPAFVFQFLQTKQSFTCSATTTRQQQ